MKQKRHGKKTQNWHRPLGPLQLGRRFLRHRYDDPEVINRGAFQDSFVAVDDYWDCYDPHEDDWSLEEWYGTTDPRSSYNLDQFLSQLLNPQPLLLSPERILVAGAKATPETAILSPDHEPITLVGMIEERLVEYVKSIMHFSDNSAAIRSWIGESIGPRRNLDVVRSVGEGLRRPHWAKFISLFSPFWIRSPQTWDRDGKISLLDHLFVYYEVPGFLYSEWHREPDVPRFKWLCWFILLGQGGSLKRAAEFFKWTIPARFQHHLRDLPSDVSPTEACMFVEVKRLGGSESDFRRLLRNPAFVLDPTELSAVVSHTTFWHDTVRWLIAHRDALTDEESDLILCWAMHEYTEAERAGAPHFSWKGRRIRGVLERSVEYRRQVERPWSSYKWQGHGWDWVLDDAPPNKWSFVELTSGEQLFHEGQAMRHCVSSYVGRCASGFSAIVSIRYNDTRQLTVEIHPKTRQVVQARGPCNRQANTDEQRALSLWMKKIVRPDTPKTL